MDFWDKSQKRNELNRKYGELMDKICILQRLQSEIEIVKQQIDRERETWDMEYNVYKSSSLAEEIMMTNHFEGLAAEQLVSNFPDKVSDINNHAGKIAEVSVEIGFVLSAIDTQITLLNIKIAGLRSELAALG
ncbi:MAG: hypothetical protein HDR17_02305 [Lachnospiraceae bacterium]|nr:hypothetical protein [Lachnospiraceae bacterium]